MNTVVFISACAALLIIAIVAYIRYRAEQKEKAQKERFEQYYHDPIRELVAATEDASVEDYPHQGDVLPSGRKCPSDEYLYNITREELESFTYMDYGWLYHRVCRNWYMSEEDPERQKRWLYVMTMLNEAFDMLD
ncbi:MAG: hypothetical protein SO141_03245 [Alphaproteobacteria bacterium]|nr:hypothetical protein [Alphaproteobacteria bacterium]